MNSARKPELKDLLDLQTYLFESFGGKRVIESINQLDALNIAVFDNYVTDNGAQEWAGKMMIVLWDTNPSDYQAFNWDTNGKLKPIKQSEDIKKLIESRTEVL